MKFVYLITNKPEKLDYCLRSLLVCILTHKVSLFNTSNNTYMILLRQSSSSYNQNCD